MPDGLGFNESESALRQGEAFSSGGGVGLSPLSQSSPVDTTSSGARPSEGALSPERNPTRADQKLVWLRDMADGKSTMNLPSWESSQKPEWSASVVQMYVFC